MISGLLHDGDSSAHGRLVPTPRELSRARQLLVWDGRFLANSRWGELPRPHQWRPFVRPQLAPMAAKLAPLAKARIPACLPRPVAMSSAWVRRSRPRIPRAETTLGWSCSSCMRADRFWINRRRRGRIRRRTTPRCRSGLDGLMHCTHRRSLGVVVLTAAVVAGVYAHRLPE